MLRVVLLPLLWLPFARPMHAGEAVGAPAAQLGVAPDSGVLRKEARAELAAALLAETNRVRAAHGVRPLRPRPELNDAADDQAAFMSLMLAAQHASLLPGQHSVADRVARHGLSGSAIAENVASFPVGESDQPPTAREVAATLVAQWMASPGHRANLLNRTFTHFGGSVRLVHLFGRQWCAFGVQVFFVPRPPSLGRSI